MKEALPSSGILDAPCSWRQMQGIQELKIHPQMVHSPRRSSLMRPVPGGLLILVPGACFRADDGRPRLDGLSLGPELGAMVAGANPGGKNSQKSGHWLDRLRVWNGGESF